ncbi:hypothetical protein SUGI_0240270 [Cryptomeria japonica]|nr:hypothetical protein SUGI_0240270 [Cryptomeria japonica]
MGPLEAVAGNAPPPGRNSEHLSLSTLKESNAVPLYLLEMAPKQTRGALNSGFQLFVAIGGQSESLTNYGTAKIHNWGWRLSLSLAAIHAIILSSGILWLPKTPNNLMEREARENARAMF